MLIPFGEVSVDILNHIKLMTGISMEHLAEIFEASPAQMTHWMIDPSTISVGHLSNLEADFEDASMLLDAQNLTWDQAVSYRDAARKLSVSPYSLSFMLARRDISPMDFGCLGLWITQQDLVACRRP